MSQLTLDGRTLDDAETEAKIILREAFATWKPAHVFALVSGGIMPYQFSAYGNTLKNRVALLPFLE